MCYCVLADDGSSVGGLQPAPQPRSSPAVPVATDQASVLMSASVSDPTPALIPVSQEGTQSLQNEVVAAVDKEGSSSPVPVKPERRKKRGPPPTVPAPYAGPKKIASEVREREGKGEKWRERRWEGGREGGRGAGRRGGGDRGGGGERGMRQREREREGGGREKEREMLCTAEHLSC